MRALHCTRVRPRRVRGRKMKETIGRVGREVEVRVLRKFRPCRAQATRLASRGPWPLTLNPLEPRGLFEHGETIAPECIGVHGVVEYTNEVWGPPVSKKS
jgi:hypothetical protein